MKSTTAKYKQIIASGITRKYLVTINLTLANNTQLTLTEADIWGDSLTIETASSGTDTFDLGCAVIGRCKFSIENHDERFSSYDFFNATAVVWLKLDGDTTYYRMGFFTVDEPKGSSSLITLELLDNMWKFDTDLPTLTMPAALGTIVNDLCIHCGVTLATQNFRGYNYTLSELPDEEMNCRELLQYVAMIGCNFCVINASGSLDIRWYDEIPAYDHLACVGDYVGVYVNSSNENTYANIDRFMRNYEVAIGTGDITITGVKITIDDTDYQIGSSGYMLKIENPLVTVDNVSAILNLIWGRLAGFTFRTFDVTMLSDLAVEVGDACAIRDIKGNIIYSIVTNNSFELSTHSVSTGAVTPTRSLTRNYSKAVQTSVEIARKVAEQKISSYDLAVQAMNSLAINAMGGYEDYEDLASGGRVWYLSNMPITKDAQGHCSFETGSTVFKTTGDGLFVSTDGGITWTNGYNAQTGELLVNVLHAIGINAEWINTGQLTVGGSTSGTNNPQIVVKDANNNEICTINSNGIIMGKGYIASSDYADTTPVSPYSQSGMKIDVNNKYVKSPFFGFDENGAHLKGEIEASSGHIGAASITNNAILIDGEILLWRGSGRFVFRPIDYGITGEAQVTFKVVDTYTGSTTLTLERKYDDGTVLPDSTYTLTDNTPMNIWLRSADPEDEDNYITFTFVCSERTIEAVLNSEIAYMGVGGFRGVFDGVLNSPQGKIAGTNYNSSGFTEGLYFNGIVNGYPAYVYVSPTTVLRRYYDPDVGDYVSESAFDIGDFQPKINLEVIQPSGSADEGTLVFEGTGGATQKKLWRRENNTWVRTMLGHKITISDVDLGEGALMNSDEIYIVVENLT